MYGVIFFFLDYSFRDVLRFYKTIFFSLNRPITEMRIRFGTFTESREQYVSLYISLFLLRSKRASDFDFQTTFCNAFRHISNVENGLFTASRLKIIIAWS